MFLICSICAPTPWGSQAKREARLNTVIDNDRFWRLVGLTPHFDVVQTRACLKPAPIVSSAPPQVLKHCDQQVGVCAVDRREVVRRFGALDGVDGQPCALRQIQKVSGTAQLGASYGSVSVRTLLLEASRGRLVIERIGNKDFTTLTAIEAMRELCRVPPQPPRLYLRERKGQEARYVILDRGT